MDLWEMLPEERLMLRNWKKKKEKMCGSREPVFRIYIDLYKMQPFLVEYISIRKILYDRFVLLVFPPGTPRKSRQCYNVGAGKPDVNIKSVNSAGQWFFSAPAASGLHKYLYPATEAKKLFLNRGWVA